MDIQVRVREPHDHLDNFESGISNSLTLGYYGATATIVHAFALASSFPLTVTLPPACTTLTKDVIYDGKIQGYNRLRGTLGLPVSAPYQGRELSIICARRLCVHHVKASRSD